MTFVPNRIFVAIGVSMPEHLDPLPGVIHAAVRMAEWGGAHGYLPILIHDAPGQPGGAPVPVTVELLREKIGSAIDRVTHQKSLQRLIVFFAGHGSAEGLSDQYWLLSNWRTDPNQAVKVNNFQRMLEYYGPRQVAIIADACQEYSRDFTEIIGSAVLNRPDEERRDFELDRFLAADAGAQSFMVKAIGDEEPYCLFSEVILDALAGNEPGAFEDDGASDCITSQSLHAYIQETIPLEASRLNLVMTPRSQPGFHTDRVYLRGKPPVSTIDLTVGFPPDAPAPKGEFASSATPRDQDHALRATAARDRRARKMAADASFVGSGWQVAGAGGISVEGADVTKFATARETRPGFGRRDLFFPESLNGTETGDFVDVLVDLEDGRTAYLCAISGFMTELKIFSETEASVLHRYRHDRSGASRRALELLLLADSGSLSEEELVDGAARLRRHKHSILTIGCIVSQFYDALRDAESISQVAYYYSDYEQVVPLDVALLSGGRLSAHGSRLYLDIPSTTRRAPRTIVERNLPFTFRDTPAREGVAVGGLAPWMRSAWGAVETANFDESAYEWRDAALGVLQYLAPGQFTMVKPQGRDALAALVGIADQKPEPLHGAASG